MKNFWLRLKVWTMIIAIYVLFIILPLLKLAAHAYLAITDGRWGWAAVSLGMIAVFLWMLICAWLDVEAKEKRRQAAQAAAAEGDQASLQRQEQMP